MKNEKQNVYMNKKFEYKVLHVDWWLSNDDIKDLDELGNDGWELCSIVDSPSCGGKHRYYFKRELCLD